jgi:hypothetical protein
MTCGAGSVIDIAPFRKAAAYERDQPEIEELAVVARLPFNVGCARPRVPFLQLLLQQLGRNRAHLERDMQMRSERADLLQISGCQHLCATSEEVEKQRAAD